MQLHFWLYFNIINFYTEKSSRFVNNPDYVQSVFVFSNTSNNDKRSYNERLRKHLNKQQTTVTTKKRSEQVDLNDSEMLDREDLQSDSPMFSNATNEETSCVPSLVVAEEDVTTERT